MMVSAFAGLAVGLFAWWKATMLLAVLLGIPANAPVKSQSNGLIWGVGVISLLALLIPLCVLGASWLLAQGLARRFGWTIEQTKAVFG
jgi:hypothetical protein